MEIWMKKIFLGLDSKEVSLKEVTCSMESFPEKAAWIYGVDKLDLPECQNMERICRLRFGHGTFMTELSQEGHR